MLVDFSERLLHLRTIHKISQTDLASKCGLSYNTISRYENKDVRPTVDNIVKIAYALNSSADYLLGMSELNLHPNHPTLNLFYAMESLDLQDKKTLLFVIDAMLLKFNKP